MGSNCVKGEKNKQGKGGCAMLAENGKEIVKSEGVKMKEIRMGRVVCGGLKRGSLKSRQGW